MVRNFTLASLAAVGVVTVIVLILNFFPDFALIAWVVLIAIVVSLLHAFVLGFPIFSLLARKNKINSLSVSVAGFLIGGLPIFTFSAWMNLSWNEGSGYRATRYGKTVTFIEDGSPTLHAWLQNIEIAFYCGILGLLGARIFYYFWKKFEINSSHQ